MFIYFVLNGLLISFHISCHIALRNPFLKNKFNNSTCIYLPECKQISQYTNLVGLGLVFLMVLKHHFQQYFSYIVAVSFIGRGN